MNGITVLLSLAYAYTCDGIRAPLVVYNNVTDAEYFRMPHIFHFDDYDRCMVLKEKSLYCYTTFQLSQRDTNQPSEVWDIIKKVISLPRNYRHDRHRHGVCVSQTCPEIPQEFYAVWNGTNGLWKGLSECYTNKYKHLNIKAEVTNIICENHEPVYEVDRLDIFYASCMFLLLGLIIAGTTYRCFQKDRSNTRIGFNYDFIMNAFAIQNNWNRLCSETTSEDGKALLPIQGIRVYNMIFVIMSHTLLASLSGQILNTQYPETVTLKARNMFVSNGSLACQTFFIISGWLLSYMMCVTFYNKKVNLGYLIMAFVQRLLRLTPVLLITIGFGATWQRHWTRGPVWHKMAHYEYINCRNNWLWNILYINNYYKSTEMCLQQTWSLAADTQLFILGLLVMMFVINKPKYRNFTFGFLIVLGILITFVEHYYYEYDIMVRSYPENLYYLYLKHDEWLYLFVPTHHNISCYIQGLMCGYYFYIYKKEKRTILQSANARILWYIFVWVGPLVTILIAKEFFLHGFQTSRFTAAFYASISRYSFGLSIAVMIFGFTFGIGGLMRKAVSWEPFNILGRLSYCIFLVHGIPIRFRHGALRTPEYVGDYKYILDTVVDVVTGYALGLMVCIFIELPMSALMKLLNQNPTKEKVSKKDS